MRDTILIPRDLARQVELLCEWIAETPHQRGSINGQAAQVHHAVSQALAAAPQPAQETDAQKLATAIAEAATRAGITDASQHSFSGPQLLMLLDDLAEMAAPQPAQPPDDYEAWYGEAMCASNEAGFSGMSAAETIRELSRMLVAQEPVATLHDDCYWTPKKTEAGRKFNDAMNKAGSRADVYTAPQPQRQTLTDEFVRLVVRSKQPHLSTESKAWKDLFASCKYWLEAAHGIGDKQ